jgi:hypothetical protein
MRVCVSLVQCEQSEGCAREKTKYDCYDHFSLSLFTMPNEDVFLGVDLFFYLLYSRLLVPLEKKVCLLWLRRVVTWHLDLGSFDALVFASRLNCILHFLDLFLFSLNYRAAVVVGVVFLLFI